MPSATKPRKETPQDRWNAAQIARSSRFTAALFLGRGRYDKREFDSLDEAKTVGATMTDKYGRRALIYAVTPEGWSIHVPD